LLFITIDDDGISSSIGLDVECKHILSNDGSRCTDDVLLNGNDDGGGAILLRGNVAN